MKLDILAWKDKVKVGGILAGHDYSWCEDVKKAVDEIFDKVEESEGCWIWRKVERKTRIYDCFPFFNETELLNLRLKHLWNFVDKFVIVESNITHRANSKPWILEGLLNTELSWAKEKIIYVKKSIDPSKPLPATNYPEKTEENDIGSLVDSLYLRIDNLQRNAIVEGLYEAYSDDVIMISDLDEFPNQLAMEEIPSIINITERFCFVMRNFSHYLDIENMTETFWCGTVIGRKRFLTTPQDWRDNRGRIPWQSYRGYHFSWLRKYSSQKLDNTAHHKVSDMKVNLDLIKKEDGTFDDLFEREGHHCVYLDVLNDPLYPKALIEESYKFPELFWRLPTNEVEAI